MQCTAAHKQQVETSSSTKLYGQGQRRGLTGCCIRGLCTTANCQPTGIAKHVHDKHTVSRVRLLPVQDQAYRQAAQGTDRRAMLAAKLTWSSVLIVGERPPWTQKIWLSMMADRLHQEDTQQQQQQQQHAQHHHDRVEGSDKAGSPNRKHAPQGYQYRPTSTPGCKQDWPLQP
jgi:hypothetical protein